MRLPVFNIRALYYLFFTFFAFISSGVTFFINEEALLFLSLFGMFYISYCTVSSAVWRFINAEIETIRAHLVEAHINQYIFCDECIELISHARKILFIRFYFCFWVYLVNKFAYSIAGIRCFNQANKFYLVTVTHVFTVQFRIAFQIQIKKIRALESFVCLFSSFISNTLKDIKVEYDFVQVVKRYTQLKHFVSHPCTKVFFISEFSKKNRIVGSKSACRRQKKSGFEVFCNDSLNCSIFDLRTLFLKRRLLAL
jgi:glutaredoxin-related protein